MNRIRLNLMLASFLILLLQFPAFAPAQSPPITIQLLVEKASYLPDEPIKMQITIVNESGHDVITRKGFSNQDFHMMLNFTDPDGLSVRTRYVQIGPEPGPPYRSQGKDSAFVETFPNGNKKIIVMDDAHAYYDLIKYGRYKAQVFASLETFSQAIQDPLTGDLISFLDDAGREGFGLSSNTVSFEIVSPAPGQLAVIQPNGGEVIPSGSTYVIKWTAPSTTVKFDLKYSMNNGTTWKSIADKVTGTSYNWAVPVPKNNKKKCLVKVIGYDSSNANVGEDRSDSAFTIEVVKVTSPNGEEVLKQGSTHTITWRTNVTIGTVAKVELYYTTGGGIWKLITTRSSNTGSYPWTLPYVSSIKCKVKVVLKDASGKAVGSDISDKVFTIKP